MNDDAKLVCFKEDPNTLRMCKGELVANMELGMSRAYLGEAILGAGVHCAKCGQQYTLDIVEPSR